MLIYVILDNQLHDNINIVISHVIAVSLFNTNLIIQFDVFRPSSWQKMAK